MKLSLVRAALAVAVGAAPACSGSAAGADAAPGGDAVVGGDGGGADGSRADAAPVDYCDDLPALPTVSQKLNHVPAAEDFTFDAAGNLVGVSLDSRALTATPYAGSPQVIVPNLTEFARGTRYLPGGDLLVADPQSSSLRRVTPAGGVTTVLAGLPDPNGLVIAADGMAYLTHGGGEVRRINPSSGDFTAVVSVPMNTKSFDGIVFSLDYQTLYYNEESGAISALNIASGQSTILTTLPTEFLLDGMTLDECGNLYVVEMAGLIWRVTPAGDTQEFFRIGATGGGGGPGSVFIPALNFGSGRGGWRRDALYVMDFSGGVHEILTNGVRGRLEPHLVAQ